MRSVFRIMLAANIVSAFLSNTVCVFKRERNPAEGERSYFLSISTFHQTCFQVGCFVHTRMLVFASPDGPVT